MAEGRSAYTMPPVCSNCRQVFELEQPHAIIREQYWPGTPQRKSFYMFDQDLFQFYDLLQKNMPGVSEQGFLKTLEQMSELKGRVRPC